MQSKFDKDKTWSYLREFSERSNCNLAKTQFGNVLEDFRQDTIGIWLRHNLELS